VSSESKNVLAVGVAVIDGKQPAFSEIAVYHWQADDKDGKHDNVLPRWHGGLTKREYFAAVRSMTGCSPQAAVEYADALIAELNLAKE
jgi:hypothetical protein